MESTNRSYEDDHEYAINYVTHWSDRDYTLISFSGMMVLQFYFNSFEYPVNVMSQETFGDYICKYN